MLVTNQLSQCLSPPWQGQHPWTQPWPPRKPGELVSLSSQGLPRRLLHDKASFGLEGSLLGMRSQPLQGSQNPTEGLGEPHTDVFKTFCFAKGRITK